MSRKILLIDDMSEIVKVISEYLKSENYQVFTATNGMDGISINEAEDPDLIILDLRMPIMDGIETLQEIRKTDEKVKVIILSGYLKEYSIKDIEGLGISEYLNKPFNGIELLRAVVNVLDS